MFKVVFKLFILLCIVILCNFKFFYFLSSLLFSYIEEDEVLYWKITDLADLRIISEIWY